MNTVASLLSDVVFLFDCNLIISMINEEQTYIFTGPSFLDNFLLKLKKYVTHNREHLGLLRWNISSYSNGVSCFR